MKKIILKGYIVVPEKEIDIVKKALKEHIYLTRDEDGCLVFKIDQDENDKKAPL